MAFTDLPEITKAQEDLKVQMKGVNENISKIKNSLAKAISQKISSAALNYIGLPFEVPRDLAYFSLGVIGFGLSLVEQIRLKPYLKELKELEKQYNANGLEYSKLLANTELKTKTELDLANKNGFSYDPATGQLKIKDGVKKLDSFTESLGIPQWLRDKGLDPNIAYAVYPVAAFVGYEAYQILTKRKKRRKK